MTTSKASALAEYRAVQDVAKQALEALGPTLGATDTERSIADRAASLLRERGLPDTWYYDCPAFVLLGARSRASMSGRVYRPADERVGERNLVTVDLSPCRGDTWGDCARSFCIEDGCWVQVPEDPEFAHGLAAQQSLHAWLLATATPGMRADELFESANDQIRVAGYENLDFAGNVGHSIVRKRDERRYLERGALALLGELSPFTFEPHIRRQGGGRWGFKHEDIYMFDVASKLVEV